MRFLLNQSDQDKDDEGLTSEMSVTILSFLRCRIYIFITAMYANQVLICKFIQWLSGKKI